MSVELAERYRHLAVRWTIGEVHQRGFEMLRLSMHCAWRLFGSSASYMVCVNSLAVSEAKQRTGPVPTQVEWMQVTRDHIPGYLNLYFGDGLIEGMGWKLAPVRAFPKEYELTLDNDVILWDMPGGMRNWLTGDSGALFAEDVDRCLGSFDSMVPPGCFNAGIRGLSPNLDFNEKLRAVVEHPDAPRQLTSEIEEQGLHTAAIFGCRPLHLVRRSEVTICSPFWPRSPDLGTCGAHFVGMNAMHLAWDYYDRPADEWLTEHWEQHRPALYERAGLAL